MAVRDHIEVRGYVTKEAFLVGRTLLAFERLLGFRAGRLAQGATIAKLDRLPLAHEFDLAGYSMTAQHHFAMPGGLDGAKLKQLAISTWAVAGGHRLVKVMPRSPHDASMADDEQYPPGDGVPQWKLTVRLPATITAELTLHSEVYRPVV